MKVSIIGATGIIGSTAAFNIALHNLADKIVLVSRRPEIAAHHVTDIQNSMVGRGNTWLCAGFIEDIKDSDVVIVAASAPIKRGMSRRDYLLANLPIISQAGKAIAAYCPEAVIITVTNPVDVFNYFLHSKYGLSTNQLIGYTLNDTLRFRRLIAEALKIEAKRVRALVIGAHGRNQVPLFSSITVDGESVVLNQTLVDMIRTGLPLAAGEINALLSGLTSPWTSSIGLSDIISSINANDGAMLPCSVNVDGEFGCRGISIGVPAIIGREGVKRVKECLLWPDEEAGMRRSADSISVEIEDASGFL